MTQNALLELSPDLIDKLHECPMYTFDGHCVPRATTILSSTLSNEAIVFWANNLGFKGIGYRQELNRLAAIGTLTHNQIEEYLGKGIYPEEPTPSFESFLQWWEKVNRLGKNVSVVCMEKKMACPWYGGTMDMLLDIEGFKLLVDFKTSSSVSYRYILQLTAYKNLMEVNGLGSPNGILVLQLPRDGSGYKEYSYSYRIPEHAEFLNHAEENFFQLVKSYWYTKIGEDMFKRCS